MNYCSRAFSGQFFRICSPKERHVCLGNNTLRTSMVQQRTSLCRQDCKLPCEMMELSSQISLATMTRESSKNQDHRKDSSIQREGVSPVYLHIFFKQFQVTVIQEIGTLTFASVIGSIGGAMGAFLGASLITVTEFIVFALCYCLKQSTFRRRKVQMCPKRGQS